jgi:hypothetical protein
VSELGPVVDQQILAGAAGTLAWQYLDADGEAADPGTVTVGVTRADGTVLVAAGTATAGTGTNPRTTPLTAAQTNTLDLLTATWTRTADATTYTTRAELVGGYYFSVARARATDSALGDTTKYPDVDIRTARAAVESEWERITATAFVPRFRREALDGGGDGCLLLPTPYPRRIRSVTELANDGTETAWPAGDVANIRRDDTGLLTSPRSFPCGHGNVVVAWEHGLHRPPPGVLAAALLWCRYTVTRPRSAVPDRAQTFQLEGGTVYRLDTADRDSTGIPDIDAELDRWSNATPGLA